MLKEKIKAEEKKQKVREAYNSIKQACLKKIYEKEEEKKKEKLENIKMLEEYTAILEKQEKNREEQRLKHIIALNKKLNPNVGVNIDSLKPSYYNEVEEKANKEAEEKNNK